ncbi:hypothetical protein BaRGS_00003198, partial [Batillaria attramentaria]
MERQSTEITGIRPALFYSHLTGVAALSYVRCRLGLAGAHARGSADCANGIKSPMKDYRRPETQQENRPHPSLRAISECLVREIPQHACHACLIFQ